MIRAYEESLIANSSKRDLQDILKLHHINKTSVATSIISSGPISSFNKINMSKLIVCNLAAKRIQKFLRKSWSIEDICPVSLESVKYPIFAFKPKGSTKFIYYNLNLLCDYLITTGDFRDPKTREEYTEITLKSIDKEMQKNGIKLNVPKLKSVLLASKNKAYYRKKKDIEDTLLIIDRCLDDAVSSLRSWIESERSISEPSISFMVFRSYFRRLVSISNNDAVNMIKRTLITINKSVKNPDDKRASDNRDNVIAFLYQTLYDEVGIMI